MARKRFDEMPCSVARTLDTVGDWWTLLIVRDAMLGVRRFSDFHARTGIAKNILTDRLRKLVADGILERVAAGAQGRRYEYVLTEKGAALFPVLTALREWGDRWIFGAGNEPLIIKDKRTRRPVPPLRATDADGRPITLDDIYAEFGPGLKRTRSSGGPADDGNR